MGPGDELLDVAFAAFDHNFDGSIRQIFYEALQPQGMSFLAGGTAIKYALHSSADDDMST